MAQIVAEKCPPLSGRLTWDWPALSWLLLACIYYHRKPDVSTAQYLQGSLLTFPNKRVSVTSVFPQ